MSSPAAEGHSHAPVSWLGRGGGFALRFMLGPWPIRPVVIAVFYVLENQVTAFPVAQVTDRNPRAVFVSYLPVSLLGGALLGLTLYAANRFLPGGTYDPTESGFTGRARARYLLIAVLGVLALGLADRAIVGVGSVQGAYAVPRNLLTVLVISAIFGITDQRLREQMLLTRDALNLMTAQRQRMLESEERARRDVANYLHDHIQTDLVVFSRELWTLAGTLPADEGKRVRSIVDEIDGLRRFDIRAASRRLSPDIHTLGLEGALRELVASYRESLSVTLECTAPTGKEFADVALAAFRIVEQAILNAAVHGHAQHVQVFVGVANESTEGRWSTGIATREPTTAVSISVSNDGIPLANTWVAGTGTAVIDAWVNRFNGEWRLESVEDTTRLRATLRIPVGRLPASSILVR